MFDLNHLRSALGGADRSQRRETDLEAGRASLLGAHLRDSEPLGSPRENLRHESPSPRRQATLIGGVLQRLSLLGKRAGERSTDQAGLLPSHHTPAMELQQRPRPQESRASGSRVPAAQTYAQLEEKLEKEVEEVLSNTFNWKKAGTQTGKALARGAAAGGAIYGAYSLVDGMIQAKAPAEQQGTARGFVAMGMLTPVYQEGKELINGLREAVTTKAKLTYAEALELTHHRRQAESADYLKTLPEHIQKSCKKIDLFLMQALNAAKKGDKVNYSLIRGMLHWRKDFMIGRPMKTREVTGMKTGEGRAQLMGQMNQALRRYPANLRDKLSGFTLGIATRSLERELPPQRQAAPGFDVTELGHTDDWHQWTEPPKVPKQMMMLAGTPGTGKTHYAEKVLPRLLGLPVPSLVLPDRQAGGINSLMAKEWSALEQDEFVTADTDAMGKIGLLLNRTGCLNPIMLLDEADLDDMDGIKRLTDPSRDTLEATALETFLDFGNVTILMGTNALKRAPNAPVDGGPGELEPALADRMEMALFEGTDPETKREAAVSAYHGWAGLYCLPVKGGDGPILDEEQQTRLQALFKDSLDYLVDTHHDKAKIPGARMQVPVASVVNFVAHRLLSEEHLGTAPIQSGEVRQYIDQFYSLRMNRPIHGDHTGAEPAGTRPESSRMARQRAIDAANDLTHFAIGEDSDTESLGDRR